MGASVRPTDQPARLIEVRSLSKTYGAVHALRDVDLAVAAGEIVALLGANGAGKSTLLRILGTTVLPDAGTARLAGHDVVADPTSARRSAGFLLAEERSWYWRLTGRHNLEFFAALHGMPRAEARSAADALIEEVGLGDAADRQVRGYSSGMRMRLSIARALLGSPPVLLLDEPTRTLDPIATREFGDNLRDLADRRDSAVLLATHDLHEAATVADRIALLVQGRIVDVLEGEYDAAVLERGLLEAQA